MRFILEFRYALYQVIKTIFLLLVNVRYMMGVADNGVFHHMISITKTFSDR